MAILKGKADAGQGGKLGHSNQNHWEFTEEIKEAARKRRRLSAKVEIAVGLAEFAAGAYEDDSDTNSTEDPAS